MRCHYCFQALPDHTKQCPHCGSRLTGAKPKQPSKKKRNLPIIKQSESTEFDLAEGESVAPFTRSQISSIGIGAILFILCSCFVLVAMFSPGLLPQPVIAVLPFLASPTPSATPQVTRTTIETPTPVVWLDHENVRGGFTVQFPAGWLIANQTRANWTDQVRDWGEQYPWAETLFETGIAPASPQTRALNPAGINLPNQQVTVFTFAQINNTASSLSEIEAITREEPERLAQLAGGLSLLSHPETGYNFTNQRNEPTSVNGQPALLVEFTADTLIQNEAVRVRVRLYFVDTLGQLYLASYFADETSATNQRGIYDQIIQSFTVN